jgi:hypothetical protein
MLTRSVNLQSRFSKIRGATLLVCLFCSLSQIRTVRADDDAAKANRMLEALKQRSAAERWQRVKQQYPVGSQLPNRSVPEALPQDSEQVLRDTELPPLPAEGLVIPRISATPGANPDDWVLPTRPSEFDESSQLTQAVPKLTRRSDTDENGSMKSTEMRVASQNMDAKSGATEKNTSDSPRSPLDRMIGTINPYYDRDRDRDIREFALEKGKEFKIPFKSKTYEERSFPLMTMAWEPTNFYYYPLYFSDPALERYGHTYHPAVQPVASFARAGVQFLLLPYQMTITPPCKQEYPLGWYRPGECAPKLHYQIPLNAKAAVVEAAVVTGLFFAIP